jgi:hypothetical protein
MLPLEIISLIVARIIDVLLQPLFWLVVAFIGYQHWQMQRMQIQMFGEAKHTLVQMMGHAGGYGLIGGILGSILLVIIGIPINNLGIEYIWPVALLLTFVHVRYLCFAYAGGLIGVSSLLFGWPQVYVPGLIALIAVLHITESLLIAISGTRGSTPVIIQTKQGELIGGFQLQNLWPLPLVLLWSDIQTEGLSDAAQNAYIQMPSWWPLLKSVQQIPAGHVLAYTATTIVAALGYAERAVSTKPGLRRRQSAKHLFFYSFGLLLIALASQTYPMCQMIAALCAPIGHELLIWSENQREQKGAPLFRFVPDGVMILDVFPGTMAAKLGLTSGDIIQKINGRTVYRRSDIAEALRSGGNGITIQFRGSTGIQQTGGTFPAEAKLGAITVPEGYENYYVVEGRDGAFDTLKYFWKRITRRVKRF